MSEAGDSAAARPEQNDAVAPGEAPTVAADVARADVAADAREPTDAGDGAAGSGTEPPAAESEPGAPVSAGGGAPQGGGDAIASQPPVSQKAADGDAAASSSEARREDENVATACDGDSSQPEAAAAADAGSDRTAAPDGAQASGPQPAGAPPAAAHPEPAAAPHAASDGPATAPATAPRSSEPTAPPGDAAPPDAPAKAAPTPAPAASESAEAPAPATPALGPPQFTAERPADLPVPWPRSLPPKLTGRFVVRAGPHSGRIVGAPEMCASVERLHAGLSGAPLPPIDECAPCAIPARFPPSPLRPLPRVREPVAGASLRALCTHTAGRGCSETMRQLRQAQRAAMIDKGRVLSAAEAEEVSMRLYTAKAERPQVRHPLFVPWVVVAAFLAAPLATLHDQHPSSSSARAARACVSRDEQRGACAECTGARRAGAAHQD